MGDQALRRIAVVNRGEAAMRLINAVRELRVEQRADIRAIALHTKAERTAMFVREADEAVCLDQDHPGVGQPYLDLDVLERALVRARADSAWVGWGFVAERPEFAELCDRLGIVFIGPSAEVMRRLGDKIGAKLLAEQSDVPVAPWSHGAVDDLPSARRHAAEIGYPLMVKATAGGGGRGIRRVEDDAGLADAFESARSEGQKAFGDATVFMERVVSHARHVEVQLIADAHGTVWAAGVRDCSLQRRNQKVMEESHCLALTAEQDRDLRAAAVRLARAAGYQNAGTVEFLYQPREQRFAFLEVNTRLQVEHPVTELTTGLDLVKLQLHVAAGGRLDGEPPRAKGHAIEARLNAEDPQQNFAPAPGTIETLSLPLGPGIRVDTGVAEGDVIPPEYDSMIAKVIAHGRDRAEAIARLHRALSQMTVIVRGGTTNKSFLLDLLGREEVLGGDIDTSWLDRLTGADQHRSSRDADVGLVAAVLDAGDLFADLDRAAFLGWASRGRPQAQLAIGRRIELRHGGQSYAVDLRRISADRAEIEMDGLVAEVEVERLGRGQSRLTFGDRRCSVVSSVQGSDHLVEVDGVAHRFSRDDAGIVRAPAAALVVRVDVSVDDVVAAGARLGVVEAMKMEITVAAPIAGRVRDVLVTPNAQVDAGAPMFRIEALRESEEDAAPQTRLTLELLGRSEPADPGERRELRLVEAFMLGFDVEAATALRAVEGAGAQLGSPGPRTLAILDAFADLVAVSAEPRDADEGDIRGPRELFNAYLRSLDLEREGLPAWFGDRLRRAVAHYGVTDLAPGPALEEALLRIFLAQQRRQQQVGVITALLDGLLVGPADEPAAEPASGGDAFRDTLDRLIDATRRRLPAVAGATRSVRHRRFDRPHIDRARAEVSATMRGLAAGLVGADLESGHFEQLVAGPLPLLPLLAEEGILASAKDPAPLLEVLTRRYYKIRDLGPMTPVGPNVLCTSYRHRDRRIHVAAVRASGGALPRALADAASALDDVPAQDTAVVDIYLPLPAAASATTDVLADELATALADAALPVAIRRVALVASHPSAPSDVLTFRRFDDVGERPFWMSAGSEEQAAGFDVAHFEEDLTFRGMHPMIARRLQMWRLANFEISRMPATGEVHLFDCVGRANPSDERLVAVAEVRDVTAVRDQHGRVVAIPEVEFVLVAALDAIRQAMSERPRLDRLEWNRIMLYVWPPVDLPLDELSEVARRLLPLTEGLGLEQVVVSGRFVGPGFSEPVEAVVRLGYEPGRGLTVRLTEPPAAPMQPLDDYTRKVIQCRRRGLVYPYELVPLLCRDGGRFVEHDLDDDGSLVAVDRAPGLNRAGVVVGVVTTPTDRYQEGITRVAVLGDPTRSMGAITEAECRRVMAAVDLAVQLDVPIEWFAVSAGARISMSSGSENLDWVARVLRRLVEHTQLGGEVNVVVAGINVGAQPYWNAEATMLMHTRGILVMTPDSAMILTGKQAIDYSGGVSAEDNLGIGGYARVMGPNGEAQHWAPSLAAACDILFDHYELTYRAPGERWPRPAPTDDPLDRDVGLSPHHIEGIDFTTVADIFSTTLNPDRKKPFDIRTLMNAVVDRDHEPQERWPEMAEAEMAVVYDARLGGHAVTVIGMESRPLPRHGTTPADGPAQWSAGTLFPLSSKKIARAINAASGCRPVVVLANLSGFDGSPESLRRLQLEYGAEIGRAIVNFDGPFVLCVVSRYHGGAFVVFSSTLNEGMEVLAVEGSFASVIGGAPAAAVVFTRDVDERTRADQRVREMEAAVSQAPPDEVGLRQAELAARREAVRTEKLGEVAAEFDAIHSVQRAKDVGSVHRIIAAADLRPELVAAVERGMARVDRRRQAGR